MNWYKTDDKNNEKWNEHATATRVKNIIKFQEESHKYKLKKWKYNKIISEHCEFLSDEKYYKNNNHGIMMDIALIYSSSVLKDNIQKKIYLEKAIYRIKTALYRDFSRMGVHLENSPEYHKLVLILFKDLNEALTRHNIKLDKEINLMITNAQKYKQIIIKPDLSYPLIGDTGLFYEHSMKKYIMILWIMKQALL
ncbi:heparinase II/III family protein [Jeotgalicoccus sp. WY2]|uniref:heparinase II/III family protein n=1 Tax=Jeotgalicoccus sp. WY2 TaxID=2708346 RepID=UPI001BD2EBB7|nr:heparinase II/III family protein [Jeotgalicoccus sp. WY2]